MVITIEGQLKKEAKDVTNGADSSARVSLLPPPPPLVGPQPFSKYVNFLWLTDDSPIRFSVLLENPATQKRLSYASLKRQVLIKFWLSIILMTQVCNFLSQIEAVTHGWENGPAEIHFATPNGNDLVKISHKVDIDCLAGHTLFLSGSKEAKLTQLPTVTGSPYADFINFQSAEGLKLTVLLQSMRKNSKLSVEAVKQQVIIVIQAD